MTGTVFQGLSGLNNAFSGTMKSYETFYAWHNQNGHAISSVEAPEVMILTQATLLPKVRRAIEHESSSFHQNAAIRQFAGTAEKSIAVPIRRSNCSR
jgi:hypothetical protein